MSIRNSKWSKREKKIARKAFDKAYQREMEIIKKEILNRLNKMKSVDQIWDLHDFLSAKRNNMADKYDYRYSMLITVFGKLLAEGYISEEDLCGLDDEKLTSIKNISRFKK